MFNVLFIFDWLYNLHHMMASSRHERVNFYATFNLYYFFSSLVYKFIMRLNVFVVFIYLLVSKACSDLYITSVIIFPLHRMDLFYKERQMLVCHQV